MAMRYSKYGARKTVIDGITFDSKREANRYQELKLLEQAGEISYLELQPSFILQESFKYQGKTIRAITYKADFAYHELASNAVVVEDVKGMETEVFRIKRKLFLSKYGETYDFRIIK